MANLFMLKKNSTWSSFARVKHFQPPKIVHSAEWYQRTAAVPWCWSRWACCSVESPPPSSSCWPSSRRACRCSWNTSSSTYYMWGRIPFIPRCYIHAIAGEWRRPIPCCSCFRRVFRTGRVHRWTKEECDGNGRGGQIPSLRFVLHDRWVNHFLSTITKNDLLTKSFKSVYTWTIFTDQF